MKVLVDMDCVMVDFIGALIEKYNEKYSADIVVEDITAWNLPQDMTDIFMNDPNFFLDLLPFPKVIEGIRHLAKYHSVFVVTDPSDCPNIEKQKNTWMKFYLPEIPIICTKDKSKLNGDVLIDDAPYHLEQFKGKLTICVDWPWNREVKADVRVFPGFSWKDITFIINHLE